MAHPVKNDQWFDVDRDGLGAILERKGKNFAALELVQNGWDAEGSTTVHVIIESIDGTTARVRAADDSPGGFSDITHAYRLFAPSEKKADPTKRGRFNLGEKLVLSLAEHATIVSTTAAVRFDADGRSPISDRTEKGSVFDAVVRMTPAEAQDAVAAVRTLIPPPGITTTVNGEPLPERTPVATVRAYLPSEIDDGNGSLRRTRRNTDLRLHEPLPGETASIYELGIPVVELPAGDRWHVDVGQKVPVSFERDNVTPAYLRDVRTAVLEAAHGMLTAEDVAQEWVRESLGSDRLSPDTVRDVVSKTFGDKAVIFDPSDRQANNEAMAAGYAVVHGNQFTKDAWRNIKAAGALLPAGQVTPSNASLEASASEKSSAVPEQKWTPRQRQVVEYAAAVGEHLLGFRPRVELHNDITISAYAWYGGSTIAFNIGKLGKKWFENPDQRKVDALLLHEYGHQGTDHDGNCVPGSTNCNHLTRDYYDRLCDLGAALRDLSLRLTDVSVNELVSA